MRRSNRTRHENKGTREGGGKVNRRIALEVERIKKYNKNEMSEDAKTRAPKLVKVARTGCSTTGKAGRTNAAILKRARILHDGRRVTGVATFRKRS